MQVSELVSDVGVRRIGGYAGIQVMERVSMKLYELAPEEARRQENEARPGDPFIVAARKTTQALGWIFRRSRSRTSACTFSTMASDWAGGRCTRSCADRRTLA